MLTMSADGGHLGWNSGPTYTILQGDHPRTISSKICPNWPSSFRLEDFSLFFPEGPMLKLCPLMAAILDEHRLQWIQLWKGTIQGPFHQSLVPTGKVVSDEKIFHCFSHKVLCKNYVRWWPPSWMDLRSNGYNSERGTSKDHSIKVWSQLAK